MARPISGVCDLTARLPFSASSSGSVRVRGDRALSRSIWSPITAPLVLVIREFSVLVEVVGEVRIVLSPTNPTHKALPGEIYCSERRISLATSSRLLTDAGEAHLGLFRE
jgi:hypothetical protein